MTFNIRLSSCFFLQEGVSVWNCWIFLPSCQPAESAWFYLGSSHTNNPLISEYDINHELLLVVYTIQSTVEWLVISKADRVYFISQCELQIAGSGVLYIAVWTTNCWRNPCWHSTHWSYCTVINSLLVGDRASTSTSDIHVRWLGWNDLLLHEWLHELDFMIVIIRWFTVSR